MGQLQSVTTSGIYGNGTTSYRYDGLNRRLTRSSDNGVLHHIYEGDNLFWEQHGGGAVMNEYAFYPGVDKPHSVRHWNGQTYSHATDQIGNVVGLMNANNQLVNEYRYTSPSAGTSMCVKGLRAR